MSSEVYISIPSRKIMEYIGDSKKLERSNKHTDEPKTLLEILKVERVTGATGGIHHKVQVELTYDSNHTEGSQLTCDQTRYIYETYTFGVNNHAMNVDDIVETANHFCCIDMIIDRASDKLNEKFIKQLHATLKGGTSDSRKTWFAVGEYKHLPNEVGGKELISSGKVTDEIGKLLEIYNQTKEKTLEEILDFHYRFESIHPFQDSNGRLGRLILFKKYLNYFRIAY